MSDGVVSIGAVVVSDTVIVSPTLRPIINAMSPTMPSTMIIMLRLRIARNITQFSLLTISEVASMLLMPLDLLFEFS